MKERRTLQQIYYDILTAIMKENDNDTQRIRITSIQLSSNLAFDKCKEHINSMIKYNLIEKENLCITKKGYSFYEAFTKIIMQVNQIQAIFSGSVVVPAPNNTKVTTDALDYIEQVNEVLENQVKLSQQWVKFQKEMK